MKINITGRLSDEVINSLVVDTFELGVTDKTWLALSQDHRLELITEFWDNNCHLEVGYKEVAA